MNTNIYTLFKNIKQYLASKESIELAEYVLPYDFFQLYYLEFRAKTERKCTKGYSCGGTCISTSKQCRNPLDGQAKNFVEFLKLVNQKLKKEVEDLQRENQSLRDKVKNIEKNDDTRQKTNKHDYEKLEELFRKGYLEERRQQELRGVVAIKKEEMRLRLEKMGVTDDEFEVIYGKLKKDGKFFSVVEKDDELIQLNFDESCTTTNFQVFPSYWINFNSKKEKNCNKGYSCGYTCINTSKACKKTLPGQAKSFAEFLKKQNAKDEYVVDFSNFRDLIGLGERLTQAIVEEVPSTQEYEKLKKELDALKGEIKNQSLQGRISEETIKKFRELELDLNEEETKLINKEVSQLEKLETFLLDKNKLSDESVNDWLKGLEIDTSNKNVKANSWLIKDSLKSAYRLTGGKVGEALEKIGYEEERAFANKEEKFLNVGYQKEILSGLASTTLYHEFGHFVEFNNPKLALASRDFIESRATGLIEKLSVITGDKEYRDDEVAYPGNFITPYVGKVYGERGIPTEVVSVGLEHFANRVRMRHLYKNDREHFYFMIGVLVGKDKG